MSRATRVLSTVVAAAAAYALAGRRAMLAWGASHEEARMPLPGDAFVPEADAQSTMAITIRAPPSDVWPWIAQVGQGRGGFYSYTSLENAFGRLAQRAGLLPHGVDIHNADRILPEHQRVQQGDRIRFAAEPGPTMAVAEVAREHALVLRDDESVADVPPLVAGTMLTSDASTWAFVLHPLDGEGTRLLARTRGRTRPGMLPRISNALFWEPAHFVMQRKMLRGVKRRAEDLARTRAGPHRAPAPV
jgi:hypothetical protein